MSVEQKIVNQYQQWLADSQLREAAASAELEVARERIAVLEDEARNAAQAQESDRWQSEESRSHAPNELPSFEEVPVPDVTSLPKPE